MTQYHKKSFLNNLIGLSLVLCPVGFPLEERFETYSTPQSHGMGEAITADAFGYAALYHNPAGLSIFTKRRWELNLIDVQGTIGGGALGRAAANQTLGTTRFFGDLKQHPGTYSYFSGALVPSFTIRNFGISLLASHQFAGRSDGTTLDTLIRQDIGGRIGYAKYFAGNILKLGASLKALVRNEIRGLFAHSILESRNDASFGELAREGVAVGADAGAIISLPNAWLPTFGIAWLDVMNTQFLSETSIINPSAWGKPDNIPQTINVAFSVHPILGKGLKATLALEYKHLEVSNLPWRKHLGVGFQIENDKALYFWAGAQNFYPSFGVGYRVTGGCLEITTWGEEIGSGAENESDRRFAFRYTIGF